MTKGQVVKIPKELHNDLQRLYESLKDIAQTNADNGQWMMDALKEELKNSRNAEQPSRIVANPLRTVIGVTDILNTLQALNTISTDDPAQQARLLLSLKELSRTSLAKDIGDQPLNPHESDRRIRTSLTLENLTDKYADQLAQITRKAIDSVEERAVKLDISRKFDEAYPPRGKPGPG